MAEMRRSGRLGSKFVAELGESVCYRQQEQLQV